MNDKIAIINTGLIGHFHAVLFATLAPEHEVYVLNNPSQTQERLRFRLQDNILNEIIRLLEQRKKALADEIGPDVALNEIVTENINRTIAFIKTTFQNYPDSLFIGEAEARRLLRAHATALSIYNRTRLHDLRRQGRNLEYMEEVITEKELLPFIEVDYRLNEQKDVNEAALRLLGHSQVIIGADGENSVMRATIFREEKTKQKKSDVLFSANEFFTMINKRLFVLTGNAAIGKHNQNNHPLDWLLAVKQCFAILETDKLKRVELLFDAKKELEPAYKAEADNHSLGENIYFGNLMAKLQTLSFDLQIDKKGTINPTYAEVLSNAKQVALKIGTLLQANKPSKMVHDKLIDLLIHTDPYVNVLCNSEMNEKAKLEATKLLRDHVASVADTEELKPALVELEKMEVAGNQLIAFTRMNESFRLAVESIPTNENTEVLIRDLLALLKAVDDHPSPSDKRHQIIISHFSTIAHGLQAGTLTKDQLNRTLNDMEKALYGKKPLSIKAKMLIGAAIGAVVGFIVGAAATFWIGGIGAFTGMMAGAVGGAAACALGTTSFSVIGFFQGTIANMRHQSHVNSVNSQMRAASSLFTAKVEIISHLTTLAQQQRRKP